MNTRIDEHVVLYDDIPQDTALIISGVGIQRQVAAHVENAVVFEGAGTGLNQYALVGTFESAVFDGPAGALAVGPADC